MLSCCSVQTPKNKEVMVAHVNEIFSESKHEAPWVLIREVPFNKRPPCQDYRKYRLLFEPNLRKIFDLMCENPDRIGCYFEGLNNTDDKTNNFFQMGDNYSLLLSIDFMRMSGEFFNDNSVAHNDDKVVPLGTSDISDKSFSVNFRLDMKQSCKDGSPDPDRNRSHHVAVIIEKVRDNYYITDIKLEHIKNSIWIYPSLQSIANDYFKFIQYAEKYKINEKNLTKQPPKQSEKETMAR
jgi:hypothetical protein